MTGTPRIRYSSLILQGKAQACEAYAPLAEGTMDSGFTPHLSRRRCRKEVLDLSGFSFLSHWLCFSHLNGVVPGAAD